MELARSECNGAKVYHTQRWLASSQLHRLVTGLSTLRIMGDLSLRILTFVREAISSKVYHRASHI